MIPRVVIITDEPGWHGARLRQAFRERGVDARYADLARCRVDLSAGAHGIVIPGFGQRLPDGAFVRGIPGGSLEQITLRLDFLHTLSETGIPVYNEARVIERCVDKARTSLLLRRAGIPTPPTWVTEDPAEARHILLRRTARGAELVAKPLFGSMGKGLRRLAAGMDIPDAADCGGVWYLQQFVPPKGDGWRDWRVLIAGDAPVAAMQRRGRTWISNVAQGGRCERAHVDEDMRRIAVGAARAVGADYAGVDLMRSAGGGWLVIEVNSIPAWKGLQSVTETSVAGHLVDDFMQRRMPRRLEAAC